MFLQPDQYISVPILAYCTYSRFIGISVYDLRWALILKQLFKAGKNAWTTDLKCCDYIVGPAEGSVTVRCTDVWNKVWSNVSYPASITYLCHTFLIITISPYFINITSADISECCCSLISVSASDPKVPYRSQ